MEDLVGPLSSLRDTLKELIAKFIDDEPRIYRAAASRFKVNDILSAGIFTATHQQIEAIRLATEKASVVKAGRKADFNAAMVEIEAALAPF